MMKKLLILLLVLGLGTAVNAQIEPQLSLYVNGADAGDAITVNVGDVITIGVYSDGVGGVNGKYSGAVVINANATDTGTGKWTGAASLYNGAGEPLEFISAAAAFAADDQVAVAIATSAVLDDYAQEGIGMDYDFECTGLGISTISLMDDVYGPVDLLTITQIPEPVTFALLGLGGLFLRRRK